MLTIQQVRGAVLGIVVGLATTYGILSFGQAASKETDKVIQHLDKKYYIPSIEEGYAPIDSFIPLMAAKAGVQTRGGTPAPEGQLEIKSAADVTIVKIDWGDWEKIGKVFVVLGIIATGAKYLFFKLVLEPAAKKQFDSIMAIVPTKTDLTDHQLADTRNNELAIANHAIVLKEVQDQRKEIVSLLKVVYSHTAPKMTVDDNGDISV